MSITFDEYETRKLPVKERLEVVKHHLKHEEDQSVRWDCVWLAGEIINEVGKHMLMTKEIADLLVWVLRNDSDPIVRHEAAFQIGLHNFIDKVPDLVHAIMNDESDVVKHESIEALGLLRHHQSMDTLLTMLQDPSKDVRDTAWFVIKRLNRLRGQGEYKGEAII